MRQILKHEGGLLLRIGKEGKKHRVCRFACYLVPKIQVSIRFSLLSKTQKNITENQIGVLVIS